MAKKLKTVTRKGSRIEQLRTLASMLAERLDQCSEKETAQLAKQYRETIYEIEEIERLNDTDDELGEILRSRAADGESTAFREDRSKFS